MSGEGSRGTAVECWGGVIRVGGCWGLHVSGEVDAVVHAKLSSDLKKEMRTRVRNVIRNERKTEKDARSRLSRTHRLPVLGSSSSAHSRRARTA